MAMELQPRAGQFVHHDRWITRLGTVFGKAQAASLGKKYGLVHAQ